MNYMNIFGVVFSMFMHALWDHYLKNCTWTEAENTIELIITGYKKIKDKFNKKEIPNG